MLPALSMTAIAPDTGTARLSTGAAGAVSGVGAPGVSGAPGASPATAGTDFEAALARVAGNAAESLQAAEATAIQGVNGQATTKSVVEAMMAAERTLQTAVSIRDKAVSAYQEMSRMQI